MDEFDLCLNRLERYNLCFIELEKVKRCLPALTRLVTAWCLSVAIIGKITFKVSFSCVPIFLFPVEEGAQLPNLHKN